MKPLDARAERSREALLRGFVELMFRDGFDKVSVRAIVTAAGTARSTFYEHFSSKEDVLRASMAHFFGVMADCVTSDAQPAKLASVLGHFWENRRLADATFSGTPRIILGRSLSEMVEARLHSANEGRPLMLPYRLAAIQIAEAQLALIDNWLRGRAYARSENVAAALHQSSRATALALADS